MPVRPLRLLPTLAIAIVSALQATSGCSSSSALYGGGGCESFCTKWVGAHCRNGPTFDACMTQCQDQQSRCRQETNAVLRCATIEAQIACETGSGQPRMVGCNARIEAQSACLACDYVCHNQVEANGCRRAPSHDECVASCTDPRCASRYANVTGCARSECDADGNVVLDCTSDWFFLKACTEALGAEPFHALPPDSPSDGGMSGIEAKGEDVFVPSGPSP